MREHVGETRKRYESLGLQQPGVDEEDESEGEGVDVNGKGKGKAVIFFEGG